MISYSNVTVDAKANIYFDGRVVSHTVHFPDGSRKTLGLIHPGSYHFGTAAPERMDIIAGNCRVTINGSSDEQAYAAGESFDVPGNSGFTITVEETICEYVCSFLPE